MAQPRPRAKALPTRTDYMVPADASLSGGCDELQAKLVHCCGLCAAKQCHAVGLLATIGLVRVVRERAAQEGDACAGEDVGVRQEREV